MMNTENSFLVIRITLTVVINEFEYQFVTATIFFVARLYSLIPQNLTRIVFAILSTTLVHESWVF